MSYFRDFSQYSLNSSGFSCQSVGSSRVLNCLFGSLIEMSGIWAADSHSFSATQKSRMLLAIFLQEFIPPKLLMLAIITLILSYLPYFLFLGLKQAPPSNKRRTFGYPHWNKRLPLISVAPLNAAFIRIVTLLY